MLTHGRVAPANHPQFGAINCCQLRIGSCRPDLCRILGAFLHFPDNPNCGSLVICGGGEPLHPTVRTFAMCTIAGKGMAKVLSGQGQGKYKTKADTRHDNGRDRGNTEIKDAKTKDKFNPPHVPCATDF